MTVNEFILELGGTARVAREISVPLTTVHSWQRRNSIPEWRMPDLVRIARSRSVSVPGRFETEAA